LCPDCFKNSRQIGSDYRDLSPVSDRVPRLSEFSQRVKSYIVQPHEQWFARAEDDLAFAHVGFRETTFPKSVS
jgi:hypothetical protein